jgi:hypothetical protein
MGISNKSVPDIGVREERRPEHPADRRRRLENSLESGLEDTFPTSDAIGVVQPPLSSRDCGKNAGGK